ncbi:MAG: ATP-binding protein [Methanolobus sp.]|nr:ATP-binding protein [Methanolobus sp.]
MLFNKNLDQIQFEDVEGLKDNQIEESEILDYKSEYSETRDHENNILKEITAFSNSSGGFLVYGITENGRGGHPELIQGIDSSINLERLEQLIISNIRPRISVKFRKIPIPESDRCILIVFIPEGHNQPYYNNRASKYYKRYNFEAKEMDEHEIEALYQKRFFGVSQFNRYIDEIINYKKSKFPIEDLPKIIDGHIIIAPIKFEDEVFSSSDGKQLRNEIGSLTFNSFGLSDSYLNGIGSPSKYGINWSYEDLYTSVEVHRNATVHASKDYGTFYEETNINKFWDIAFGANLLQTIKLGYFLYNKYNYYGKVKIIATVSNCRDSMLDRRIGFSRNKCESDEIYVEREWNSWSLEQDSFNIGKSIMDEIYNYFGLWECGDFSVDGENIVGYGI